MPQQIETRPTIVGEVGTRKKHRELLGKSVAFCGHVQGDYLPPVEEMVLEPVSNSGAASYLYKFPALRVCCIENV